MTITQAQRDQAIERILTEQAELTGTYIALQGPATDRRLSEGQRRYATAGRRQAQADIAATFTILQDRLITLRTAEAPFDQDLVFLITDLGDPEPFPTLTDEQLRYPEDVEDLYSGEGREQELHRQ